MNIFISWSGEKSLFYAEELKKLIEGCIQAASVFCSSQDIHNGDNWVRVLFEELSSSKYGIICVDKENINSQWINFEAGAIANKLENKMTAFLIDLNASDINPPLSLYQATRNDKNSILNLIYSINETLEKKVDTNIIKSTFEHYYSIFEENINSRKFISSSREEITNKDIKSILENSNKTLEYIKRIEAVMPSLVEEIDEISKTDFQEKYENLVDKLMVFLYDLNQMNENIYENTRERFVIFKILNIYSEIFKKDKYFKKRCYPNYEKIQQKYDKFTYQK